MARVVSERKIEFSYQGAGRAIAGCAGAGWAQLYFAERAACGGGRGGVSAYLSTLVLTGSEFTVTYSVRRRGQAFEGDLGQKGVKIALGEGPT